MKASLVSVKRFPKFILVCFKLLDTGRSAKSYICTDFGNFERWRGLLDKPKGTIISGFIMRDKNTIDADSGFQIEEQTNVHSSS